MSTKYTLKNHVALVNRGRDEEFEVTCDVAFNVTPRAIEDIVVTLHADQLLYPIREAIQLVESLIEDDLAEDDIVLWAHISEAV